MTFIPLENVYLPVNILECLTPHPQGMVIGLNLSATWAVADPVVKSGLPDSELLVAPGGICFVFVIVVEHQSVMQARPLYVYIKQTVYVAAYNRDQVRPTYLSLYRALALCMSLGIQLFRFPLRC